MKSREDSERPLIRYAYFHTNLRIVYQCSWSPTEGETDVDPQRVEFCNPHGIQWFPCTTPIDVLLNCLNSSLKEAIAESYTILDEEGTVIRDTREKKTPVEF